MRPLEETLRQGAIALGLNLSDAQVGLLIQYLALIQKWNRVYNLTAITHPQEMVTHHLLDCLAVLGPLRRQTAGQPIRLLDVGSGAGLPGAVIAICCAEVSVTCVDTVGKKAAFVQQVAALLQLPNLRGLHSRVELLTERFDLVISRAFAALGDFVAWSRPALAEGGVWLAMKGKYPQEEIDALPPEVEVFHVEPLEIPGLDAERGIVWLKDRTVT